MVATMKQLHRSSRLARRGDSHPDDILSPDGQHPGNDADSPPRTTSNPDYDEDSEDDMQGVRDPDYRTKHLRPNNIIFQHPQEQLPEVIADHVRQIASTVPGIPELSPEIVAKAVYDLDTIGMGCNESDVSDYLKYYLFPLASPRGRASGSLLAVAGRPMDPHLLPNLPTDVAQWAVTRPTPDLLYGYPIHPTFTTAQLVMSWGPVPTFGPACRDIFFPFFAVEIKAVAGSGGNLWVAANQCAGASAACVQAVEQLNTRLGGVGSDGGHVLNLCYSLAIDNCLAQLYMSWGTKEDGNLVFYIQRVNSFLLSSPEQFQLLRKWMETILKWGEGERLSNIRFALDHIREEQQKMESGAAKSRPGPDRELSPETKRRRLG